MNKKPNKPGLFMLLVLLAFVFSFSTNAWGQQPKESREQRKAREKREQEAAYQKAKQAVYDTAFVILGETIQFKRGTLVPVSGNINYLELNGDESVLQIGSHMSPGPGLNNLGGVTLKGKISNLKISEKKNRIYITYTLSGLIGTARIAISVNGSDKATVDVNGMFSGNSFTMRGTLVNPGEAHIYEGTEF